MVDQAFFIRLFITIGAIWLTQFLLDYFAIKDPAHKLIFVVVIIVALIYLVTGGTVLQLH